MKWNNKSVKYCLIVVCVGVLFYTGLQHLGIVASAIGSILSLIFPFLLGGAIAFVVNVPMRAIEKWLFSKKKRGKGFRRPLALVITLLIVSGVITLAVFVIAPGIVDAVSSITAQLPAAFARLDKWGQELEAHLPRLKSILAPLDIDWKMISGKVVNMAKSFGTSLLSASGGFIGSLVSGIGTFVIAFVFSIYILLQKEKLSHQVRQIIYAVLPEKHADRFFEIAALADQTFSKFLSGQCLEACILGSLFIVFMTIFQMPYAFLVGVLIAITALIPIIGAFIGCIVGALLIAITSPVKALIFIVMFLVLQQIEGNLIYPHVVGSSVGLPSIWVLAAVTLGGKLMGVAGILLFIPLCSVCYSLFRDFVKKRLVVKNIPTEKIDKTQNDVINEPAQTKQDNK